MFTSIQNVNVFELITSKPNGRPTLFFNTLKLFIMTKFETYRGANTEIYFRLVDDKGKILLSSEGYKQKESVLSGIESVKKNLPLPTAIEKKATEKGMHFFNVKSTNGQVVGTSTMFDTPELRDKWLSDLQKEVPKMQVIDTII